MELGDALDELVARGWKWDGEVLTNPSGKKIERPSESELLKLKIGVSIKTVLAEREKPSPS
jgi:hypothetical protein